MFFTARHWTIGLFLWSCYLSSHATISPTDSTTQPLPTSWSIGAGHNTPRTHWAHLGLVPIAEEVRGVQIGLLTNIARQRVHGVQWAGLGNIARQSIKGLQTAAVFNYAGRVSGVQLAALTNIATHGARGLQLSGVSNIALDGNRGMAQLALSNTTIGALRGAQLGVVNYAGTLQGVQIGLLNMASGSTIRGVQIGLINASQDTSALKVGLVNLTPRTRTQVVLTAGNTTKANIGVRFTNGHLYTQLGIGLVYRGLNDKFSGTVNYRAGYRLPLTTSWTLLGDLGFAHIENAHEHESYRVSRMYALQARVSIEWQRWQKIGLFATGGYHHARHYSGGKYFEQKPIIELGVTLH